MIKPSTVTAVLLTGAILSTVYIGVLPVIIVSVGLAVGLSSSNTKGKVKCWKR